MARFVVVGGVAANHYGSTRVTHDLDLVPALDPDTWPSLVAALYELGAFLESGNREGRSRTSIA